jgi:hypothetical protein
LKGYLTGCFERELQAVAASVFIKDLLDKREANHVVLAGDSASVCFWPDIFEWHLARYVMIRRESG